jgi:hypothetical protein
MAARAQIAGNPDMAVFWVSSENGYLSNARREVKIVEL